MPKLADYIIINNAFIDLIIIYRLNHNQSVVYSPFLMVKEYNFFEKMLFLTKLFDVLNLKTLYFNFKYLPFLQAVKIPILISRRCRLRTVQGEILIHAPVRFGMISIGRDSVGIFDNQKSRTIWNVAGKVIFQGSAFIGHGCKISVEKDGILHIGNNFRCTAETAIAVEKSITIGDNCLFSWDILIMDTDWHKIIDNNDIVKNSPSPIVIGNHVWIGCRSTILKGVTIADDNVIAACSVVTRSITTSRTIIGGMIKLGTIKDGVTWAN